MNWLLIFFPVALALEHFAPDRYLLIFAASALSIIPLASWMSTATEHLAERTGESVGGLLNATFGNAAELIISFSALRAGMHDLVKASLAGAIIGNMLFVTGLSMLAGGLRYRRQEYNAAAARSQASLLVLTAIALILPAAYRSVVGTDEASRLGDLSAWISGLLLMVYVLSLVYSLVTHRDLLSASHEAAGAGHTAGWSLRRSALTLAVATLAIVWVSEILVGAIEPTGKALGLNDAFVGLFLVAVLASAAEWITAVKAARNNRINLSLSIAMGSSVQIALFVAPLMVLLSYVAGPGPMDLVFGGGIVLSLLLSVLATAHIAGDGHSDWFKGTMLLSAYLILALTCFFVPVL